MKGWRFLAMIAGIVVLHLILLSAVVFRPAKEVLPRANQPVLPPPEPKNNFAAGEFVYIDKETGERIREQRFVVSTRLFTGDDPPVLGGGATAPTKSTDGPGGRQE